MRIIQPQVFVVDFRTDDVMKSLEAKARLCYRSFDNMDASSADKLIASLIKRGHEAMIEHESVSIQFVCDRGVSHEIVRHRLGSYAQESTRYCNYAKDKFGGEITVIEPYFFKDSPLYEPWYQACKSAEDAYLDLLENGATAQEARSVLPNSTKTAIWCTYNLREFRHFLKLRVAPAAHPQMRQLTIPLLWLMNKKLPGVFEDIEIGDIPDELMNSLAYCRTVPPTFTSYEGN